jgi:hypothetical protein
MVAQRITQQDAYRPVVEEWVSTGEALFGIAGSGFATRD